MVQFMLHMYLYECNSIIKIQFKLHTLLHKNTLGIGRYIRKSDIKSQLQGSASKFIKPGEYEKHHRNKVPGFLYVGLYPFYTHAKICTQIRLFQGTEKIQAQKHNFVTIIKIKFCISGSQHATESTETRIRARMLHYLDFPRRICKIEV